MICPQVEVPSINIRNEMSFDDIVNKTGVWIYQPPNQEQSYANP